MHQKTTLGLFGVLGIWVTAGIAFPLVNILDMFTIPQLMVVRGFLTAGMAFIALKGVIRNSDKYTFWLAVILPFATYGLYQSTRYWGPGPTIIILAATPLVNFFIGFFINRKPTKEAWIGLILVVGGVARASWGESFNLTGFAWALFATVINGILYELLSRATSRPLQRCFWGSIGMGVLGLIASTNTPWPASVASDTLLLLAVFVFFGGFLYWIANLITFEYLPTNEASVLAQGETPAVIIGAYLILGDTLSFIQWIGVATALFGTYYLSRWVAKQSA